MPLVKTNKHTILATCWSVLHRNGYHNTSIGMLAAATGLGKSGLMHHFSSKENLMREVIDFSFQALRDYVLSVAHDNLPPEQKIEKLLRRQNRLAKMDRRGCFFANSALETALEGTFNAQLEAVFSEWQSIVADIFSEQFDRPEAEKLAYQLLRAYEGAVLLYKLTSDEQHLENIVADAVRTFGKEMRGKRLPTAS